MRKEQLELSWITCLAWGRSNWQGKRVLHVATGCDLSAREHGQRGGMASMEEACAGKKKRGAAGSAGASRGKEKNSKPGPTTVWAASLDQIRPKFGPTRWAKMGLVSKEWA